MNTPPRSDQIEISIFGPCYGESILLHAGDNNWIIVDSCIDPATKEPAPLKYLHDLGIDPKQTVQLIVASHWHDDHIRGLSEIYKSCESAEFVCSSALRAKEFLTLASALGKRSMMESPGVQEFFDILNTIKKRKQGNKGRLISYKNAIADRLIWKCNLFDPNSGISCEVTSLSPSDASNILAVGEIADLLPRAGQTKKRIYPKGPNFFAVVLWVKIGDNSFLLGSDLEVTSDPGTGWSVIVGSNTRPNGKACIFKIPHHGSKSAYYPELWDKMLEAESISLLTPFQLGNISLPTKSDIKRICEHTQIAYSSAAPISKRPFKRASTVEKTIRETTKYIREANAPPGFVRLRTTDYHPPVSWTVEKFGSATELCSP